MSDTTREKSEAYTAREDAASAANPYGYCPNCGAPGVTRERRPNGNDECEAGCIYPSANALDKPAPVPQIQLDPSTFKKDVTITVDGVIGRDDVDFKNPILKLASPEISGDLYIQNYEHLHEGSRVRVKIIITGPMR